MRGRAFVIVAVCLVAWTATVAADIDAELRRMARAAGQGRPLLRIGLAAGHAVEIKSKSKFRVVDPADGSSVWRGSFEEPITFVADGGPRGEVPRVFRIQTGAFSDRDAADSEATRLEREVGGPAIVRHDPDRGIWRVRVGLAEDRLSLNPLMEKLRASGLDSLWIAEEPADTLEGVALRLVDASYESHVTMSRRLVVLPGKTKRIEVNGKSYRGIIEVRITPFGTVRAINWIEIEKYLLGVVPAELGPEVWPELSALQAQSVAARTYAWRNRGQFEDEGFDMCDTPRCQVYSGAKAEHPLSNRAISTTRGKILSWEGEPIIAYYTATCGGHTEDGVNIFPQEDLPYLTGVPCHAESAAMATLRGTIRGRKLEPVFDETGADVTRDWALLIAAGVIDPGRASEELDAATLRRWTTNLARLAGREEAQGALGERTTLGAIASLLLDDLGWTERADVLLSGEDVPALLRDSETTSLPPDERRALAYLAWTEGIRPFPDGRFGAELPPTRARLAPALREAGETYATFGFRRGVVAGVGETAIRIVVGKGEIRLPYADRPFLFGRTGGTAVSVEQLEIWPNDRIRFRTNGRGAIDFLELDKPVKGASDDRSAAVYSWEVRKTRRELEAAINRRISIGRLKDLEVVRRGVSGRVVALRVVGTKASTVVRGFDVRRLLGLREILTVIEIQRDPSGAIRAVVFAGKGWGHGVGMCQVGAYGMALRGATYREILAHYYTGTALTEIQP